MAALTSAITVNKAMAMATQAAILKRSLIYFDLIKKSTCFIAVCPFPSLFRADDAMARFAIPRQLACLSDGGGSDWM
jgi:hypothetical protein